MPRERRCELVESTHEALSIRRQCELLRINRSTLYYHEQDVSNDDVAIMNEIRDIWEKYPFYGYRKITAYLKASGYQINHKRVQRLMQISGIQAIYAKPKTSVKNAGHKVYPYLLKQLDINHTHQVWQVDITYLRYGSGFMYLTALIDIYSRYVVGWSLSNTLDTDSCIDALNNALKHGRPNIINSDQGCQFTSEKWIKQLLEKDIKISMAGKGRCLDNVYIERFWRSFKQEAFYLNDYRHVAELKLAISAYVRFYNDERLHQSLKYLRPIDVYMAVSNKEFIGLANNKLAA